MSTHAHIHIKLKSLSRHEASGAEQKRLADGKDLEVTRLTELLARTNKVRRPSLCNAPPDLSTFTYSPTHSLNQPPSLRQELDATKEHLRAKDEVAAKLETRVRELSAEKGQLEVDVLPARVEAERLRKELEASKARLGAAEAEVDRKIDELAEERKKGGGMRLELQGKLGQAEAEAATLRERLAGAEGQLRSREGALELKEQELLAAQKHLTEVGLGLGR